MVLVLLVDGVGTIKVYIEEVTSEHRWLVSELFLVAHSHESMVVSSVYTAFEVVAILSACPQPICPAECDGPQKRRARETN
jgi:hypothetical protein